MKASIEKIKWVDGQGNTMAYVDICFDNMIIVKGFKIMNAETGRFLATPSRKGKDEKWYADVYFRDRQTADGFKDHILSLADATRQEQPAQGSWGNEAPAHNGRPTDPSQIEDPGFNEKKKELPPPHIINQCQKCGGNIIYLKTKAGGTVAVDPIGVPDGVMIYDKILMTMHIESCPNNQ